MCFPPGSRQLPIVNIPESSSLSPSCFDRLNALLALSLFMILARFNIEYHQTKQWKKIIRKTFRKLKHGLKNKEKKKKTGMKSNSIPFHG